MSFKGTQIYAVPGLIISKTSKETVHWMLDFESDPCFLKTFINNGQKHSKNNKTIFFPIQSQFERKFPIIDKFLQIFKIIHS